MKSDFVSIFETLGNLNDNVQIALSAISEIAKDHSLPTRATQQEVTLINEILIDMTTLMISINHHLLSLPQALEKAIDNNPELTYSQLSSLIKATEEEYNSIRSKLKPIVHLLRQY